MWLEIMGIIVLISGFIDLIFRLMQAFESSVILRLRSGDAIVAWQAKKITYYSYLGAKKLHQLSKRIPDADRRNLALKYSSELTTLRKKMYKMSKAAGVEAQGFVAMKEKSDLLYADYIQSLS